VQTSTNATHPEAFHDRENSQYSPYLIVLIDCIYIGTDSAYVFDVTLMQRKVPFLQQASNQH
jgi:hypothetical protein